MNTTRTKAVGVGRSAEELKRAVTCGHLCADCCDRNREHGPVRYDVKMRESQRQVGRRVKQSHYSKNASPSRTSATVLQSSDMTRSAKKSISVGLGSPGMPSNQGTSSALFTLGSGSSPAQATGALAHVRGQISQDHGPLANYRVWSGPTCPNEDRARWRIVALGQPGLCLLCPICVCQKVCQEVANDVWVVTLRSETDYILGGVRHAPVKLRRVAVVYIGVKPIPHESVGDGWRLLCGGTTGLFCVTNLSP